MSRFTIKILVGEYLLQWGGKLWIWWDPDEVVVEARLDNGFRHPERSSDKDTLDNLE